VNIQVGKKTLKHISIFISSFQDIHIHWNLSFHISIFDFFFLKWKFSFWDPRFHSCGWVRFVKITNTGDPNCYIHIFWTHNWLWNSNLPPKLKNSKYAHIHKFENIMNMRLLMQEMRTLITQNLNPNWWTNHSLKIRRLNWL